VSDLETGTPTVDTSKDPLVRLLWGCALVAAVLVALAVGIALAVGWQMTRDESPGRPVEALFLGDETRYWCVDLKPDDAGLSQLLDRFNKINDERRHALLEGTFLEHIPIPARRARLSEIAPVTLELAMVMSDPGAGPRVPLAWTARGTLSRGLLKMRAVLKVLGWVARPRADEGGPVDVDGIAVTRVGPGVALATVGNRVLAASDANRMRMVLASATGGTSPQDPQLQTLHEAVRTQGEDAWAFATDITAGESAKPPRVGSAAASFDVTEADELVFRIAVGEGGAFDGTRETCRTVASAFLPRVPLDAIDIDGDGAKAAASGARMFTGRIAGLSKRFAALAELKTSPRFRERGRPGVEEWPSAIPPPPSPPRPADPRNGTPAAPPRGETPRPPR
jgi:hypothetical protein